MYICDTEISCGIYQLVGIGKKPTKENYQRSLEGFVADRYWYNGDDGHDGLGFSFLIASVPSSWKNSVKFLKSIGFKSSGVRKNPNSGNKIALFTKAFTEKERKEFVVKRCRYCEEVLSNKKKRFCQACKKYYGLLK